MKIKGAIFDMDGTLVDSLFFWDDYWSELGIRYFGDKTFYPHADVEKLLRTMTLEQMVRRIKDIYSMEASVEDILTFSEKGLESFYKTKAKVKPGAVELLCELQARQIPICLASATAMKYVKVALNSMELAPYFSAVLSCADLGKGKDRPDIYFAAAEALGAKPAELCVFEDSYIALETAKTAGFQTVGIYDRYAFEQGRLQAVSDFYVKEGATFFDVIAQLE